MQQRTEIQHLGNFTGGSVLYNDASDAIRSWPHEKKVLKQGHLEVVEPPS